MVGAASAGGYTLLQDDKKPPPPPTTVAQAPPAATTTESVPPATQEPLPYTPAPSTPLPDTSSSSGSGSGRTAISLGGGDTSSSSTSSGGSTSGSSDSGSVEQDTTTTTTPAKPLFAVTDIALGSAAVVYAPYTASDADLGDPSRVVDGSTRTAWKAPAGADPTAPPQVGVYVDLAGKEKIRKLVLQTPTPGMSVEIYAAKAGPPAAITDAGWDHLASRAGVAEKTTIKLPSEPYRYVLVWIVGAPTDGARPEISELSLLSLQPE